MVGLFKNRTQESHHPKTSEKIIVKGMMAKKYRKMGLIQQKQKNQELEQDCCIGCLRRSQSGW